MPIDRAKKAGELRLLEWAWPPPRSLHALKAQHLLRAHALETISEVLKKQGLDALVVKGAALAETVYPDPWMREMVDIDLIVRPDEIASVRDALVAAGWSAATQPDRPLTQESLEIAFRSPGSTGSVVVEVHLGLDKVVIGRKDIRALFARSKSFPKLANLRVPGNEDQLILVVTHLAGDEFAHRPGFADIEALLSSPIDMDVVVARAREWQVTTSLYVALMAFESLRPGLVPSRALDALKPGFVRNSLVARSFDLEGWPVARRPKTLGWKWLAKQTILRDDSWRWVTGLGQYAILRAREKWHRKI